MLTQDKDVLQHARDWCEAGLAPWLCVITQCVGSSPRPIGSMLVCLDDGRQCGSISGGCVEEDMLERLRGGEFTSPLPQRLEYGLSAAENERLGLPCGGRITVLLQRLDRGDLDWIAGVMAALERRECTVRTLSLATGTSVLQPVASFEPLCIDDHALRQCFGPRMRMLLVGAGQLAHSLAELALAMDYEVLVTDPRRDILAQWEGPDVPLLPGMPDDVLREQACDEHSVIITLTHDPRIDDMALMEALESDAWYVGALGSRQTTEKRLARLRELGLRDEQLNRLHAPVGLPIGSKTPIEIAVAIMAELTALRRRRIAGTYAVTVGVLLLAAGSSRRFGSDKRRATLADGRTLLETCIDTVQASGLPCLVCVGSGDTALAGELEGRGIEVALCPGASGGMGHTLAEGVRQCPGDWEGVLIALADMPWIKASSYQAIARHLTADTIVVPRCAGVRGNPVGFGRRFFGLLEQQRGDSGARDLLARFPEAVRPLELDDPGIRRDANTPDALLSAPAPAAE